MNGLKEKQWNARKDDSISESGDELWWCVVAKDVNSGFVGTSLEVDLRRRGVNRLVIAGFFTNFCVETTTRMAGNLGFDTYLVHDGCAATNRIGPDGVDRDAELVHQMSVANLHGEFCTAITGAEAASLLTGDAHHLDRAQGNERST